MAPTNEFLSFCPTDTGTNLLTESDYLASADRVSGNKPGIASSKLNNRAIRQANAIASQVAQYVANKTGTDVVDDANFAKLLAQMTNAMTPYAPNFTKYTSGSTTWYPTYIFAIASGNATSGATYTNNTFTFTVVSTVTAGVLLKATGTGAPSVSGTLTKASGSGDATLTFYAVRAPIYIDVVCQGGGGGGAGGGTSPGAGGDGGDSSFGSALITATKGIGATTTAGGSGGAASLGSGPVGYAINGTRGTGGGTGGVGILGAGGCGANSYFGNAGGGGDGSLSHAGGGGIDGTGSGGGGGGNQTNAGASGGGGGSGATVIGRILSPAASYAVVVGAGGTAGTAGGSGSAGGTGGSGVATVTEFYQ